ncbi:6-phosphogluconolactonase [Arcobacter arenosus]|jgi:6-phosphogluconolactonase|nr:6-phosphogluconolactonase [Arcobacter arenosus]
MTNLKKFKNKEELLEELSSDIVELLQDEIEEKGKASLLVSGGSTPKPLFQKLSNIDIPWEKVIISLVDDRWLEPTHKDSNELLVKENLMQNFASKAKFVGMFIEGKTAYESDEDCSLTYEDNVFPFDVIILGMGGDSHTASLFPENEKLKEAYDLKNENLCISIKPDTAPYDRMSLTLGAILSAKNIILHIEGEEKLKVYEEALNSKDIFKTPISAVLNNERLIEVYHA